MKKKKRTLSQKLRGVFHLQRETRANKRGKTEKQLRQESEAYYEKKMKQIIAEEANKIF